jgi:putative protease
LSTFRKTAGGQELPILDLSTPEKDALSYFPQGLYVQVSTISDLYAIQSENPVRAILELNSQTKKSLIDKKETLPFSKKQIYISLDPFCPQEIEKDLISTIEYLVNDGFRYWVVNNPAHISILRSLKATCIAGPYLYAFNRWSASWLENQDIDVFISPYENSRQNLEATFEKNQRSRVLVPIFAYPALFRMRFQLPSSYDFTFFTDKEGAVFKALSTEDGSFVTPEKPFSILDKSSFLKAAGFTHFLIDFSKTQVTKGTLKQLMKSFYKGEPLPDISRFNWKDGFYSPEKMEEYRNSNERAKANGNNSRTSPKGKRVATKNKPKKR